MVNVKVTVKTGNKTYTSSNITSTGHDKNSYSTAEVYRKLTRENFPTFQGTELAWKDTLKTAKEIKIINLGNTEA